MSFSLPQQQQVHFSVPHSISNGIQNPAPSQQVLQNYSIPSNASSSSLVDMHMNPETHEAGYEEDDEEDFETLLPRSSRKPFFEQQQELEQKIKEVINASTVEDDDDAHVNWEEDDGFEDIKQEETKENIFKQIDSENEDNQTSSTVPVKEESDSLEKPSTQPLPESVLAHHQEDHFMDAASRSPPHFEDAYSMSKDFHYSTYSESEDHHSTSSQMNDSSTFYNMIESELPKEDSSHVSSFEMMDIGSIHPQQPLTSALLEAAATVAPSLSISMINAEINKNKNRKKQTAKSPTEELSNNNDDIIKGGGVAHKRHIETDEFLDDSETNVSSCSKQVLIEFKSLRDKAYLKNKFPDILYTLTWKHKYDMRITSSQPIFARLNQENIIQSIVLDIVMADSLNTATYDKSKTDEKHKYSRKKSQQDILSSSSSALDIPSGTDSMMISSSSDTSSVGAKSKRKAQDASSIGETVKIAKIKKENDREVKITLGIHPTYCSKRFAYEPFRMKIDFDETRALSASQLQQMQLSGSKPLHFVKYSTKFQTFAKKLSSDDLNSSTPPAGTSNTEISEEEHDSSSRSQQRQGRSRSKSPSVKRQRSPSLSKVPQNIEPPNQILHQTLHQTPSSSVLDPTVTQQHHFVSDVLQQPLQAIAPTFGIGNTAAHLVFPNNPFFIAANGAHIAFPFIPTPGPFLLTPNQSLPSQSMLPFNYVFPNQMNQQQLNSGMDYSSKTTAMMNGMEMTSDYSDSNLSTPTLNSSTSSNTVGYFSPTTFLTGNSTPLPPNTPPPPFTPSSSALLSPSLLKDIEGLQQSPAPQHSFL